MKDIVIILKPDVIERNKEQLFEDIIKVEIWEITSKNKIQLTREDLETFYQEYKDEDFFENNIVKNMTRTPVIVYTIRTVLDYSLLTKIKKEIRNELGVDRSNNSIHISDSNKSILREKEVLRNHWIILLQDFSIEELISLFRKEKDSEQRKKIKKQLLRSKKRIFYKLWLNHNKFIKDELLPELTESELISIFLKVKDINYLANRYSELIDSLLKHSNTNSRFYKTLLSVYQENQTFYWTFLYDLNKIKEIDFNFFEKIILKNKWNKYITEYLKTLWIN